jgi:hypothetical protein
MDNFYQQCPPIMNDNRMFTDWTTSAKREQFIKYINNIRDEHQYRLFLQSNATQFMNNQWDKLKRESSCFVNNCVHTHSTRVTPGMFSNEKQAYNQMLLNHTPSPTKCEKFADYKLNY